MSAPADLAAASAGRIAPLDMIRGAALIGILVANLPGFALPRAAYYSPLAWGGTGAADVVAWAATFVLVEGKMRGLFAFLFGASVLLVMTRAEAAGRNPVAVHLRRMAWLFAIGCAHLYLLWWGDILAHYALVGALAAPFTLASTRLLLAAGGASVALSVLQGVALTQAAIAAAATKGAEWRLFVGAFGAGIPADVAREIAAMRGGWAQEAAWRWSVMPSPIDTLWYQGPETFGYMLLGMAALRSGLLTGAWERQRYRHWAAWTLAITLPLHAAMAALTATRGFDLRYVMASTLVGSPLLRPLTIAGYAAALQLLPASSWLAGRLADAGRVALSSYLLTSFSMTALFNGWGAGQFGAWSRASLYWLMLPMTAAMLWWPGWWLQRFAQGPAEWLWRSLAQGAVQPMRRTVNTR